MTAKRVNEMLNKTKTKIMDAQTGEFVDAEIWDDIVATKLTEWDREWRSMMQELEVNRNIEIENAHWDWIYKVEVFKRNKDSRFFSLVKDGKIEGVMIATLNKHLVVGKKYPISDLLYIEYLDSGPWNQEIPGYERKFSGVGLALMKHAMRYSKSIGLGGRLGLHSLESSAGFYRKINMFDVGIDATNDNLMYFEFEP